MRGKGARSNFVAVGGDGLGDGFAEVGVGFGEGGFPGAEAENVAGDEDLTVAVGSGSDADGGDFQGGGDFLGEVGGDVFEDDGEDSGVLEGDRFVEDFVAIGVGFALLFEAELVDGLGGESNVAHDGDSGLDEFADGIGHFGVAAFEFDAVGTAFF